MVRHLLFRGARAVLAAVGVVVAWWGPAGEARAQEPAREERTLLSGWIMARGELWPKAPPAEPVLLSLPHEEAAAGGQILLRANYNRDGWLDAMVSGLFTYEMRRAGNDFYRRPARAAVEAELRELAIGLSNDQVTVRVGQQRLAWGVADTASPNDVLNARDLRDPILADSEARFVPTPMVRVDWDFGLGMLQLAVTAFVPDRFSVYGRRWSVIQPDSPAPLRGFLHLVGRNVDPTLEGHFDALAQQTSLPDSGRGQGTVGIKLAWSAGPVDVGHYYHNGYDGTPTFTLDPEIRAQLAMVDWSQAQLRDFAPVLAGGEAGQGPYRAVHVRRHHVGLDLVTTAGPLAMRLDLAFQSGRVFYGADLSSHTSPTVNGVLSLEYQTGDVDKVLVLEASYLQVLERPPQALIGYEARGTSVAGVLKWPLWGGSSIDVRAMTGISPRWYGVQPQLNGKWGGTVVSVGALLLGGDPWSFGHYFRYNREVFVKLKQFI